MIIYRGRTPHFKAEYRMRLRDGVYHWMLGRGVSVRDSDGKVVRIAGSQTDITPRKQAELKLVREALHDSLTGLSNRTAFLRELERLVKDKNESGRNFALLFLDLDYFKNVNDSLGHHAGDQFLVAVAERIRGVLRPADRLARLGGDEFAIAVQDVGKTGDVIRVADRIQEALSPRACRGRHGSVCDGEHRHCFGQASGHDGRSPHSRSRYGNVSRQGGRQGALQGVRRAHAGPLGAEDLL